MNISVDYSSFIDALDNNPPKDGLNTSFYYNKNTEKIESLESIVSGLRLSPDFFETYYYDYQYIPIPTFDEIQWEKEYIKSLNNKKIASFFAKTKDDDEFDRLFNAGIYNTWNGFVDWGNYATKVQHGIIVQWSTENNVLLRSHGKIMTPDEILRNIQSHSYAKI